MDAARMPFPESTNKCDPELAEYLIRIIENSSLIGSFITLKRIFPFCIISFAIADTPIRPVTLELCCIVIRHILICSESDHAFYDSVDSAIRRTQHKLSNALKGALQTEKLFLEMFEDEFYQFQVIKYLFPFCQHSTFNLCQ
jgi:hypothetical protein